MDVGAVVGRFGLGAWARAWLEEAASLSLPVGEGSVPLPSRAGAAEVLAPLGLAAEDEAELVALWPDGAWPAEAWWLVERMYARVVADMAVGGVWRVWPALVGVEDARARCAPVFAFAAAVGRLRALHARYGVPVWVTEATLVDVGRHVAHTRVMFGRVGLESATWVALHFRGGLYAVGRLQFEPNVLAEQAAVAWYDDAEAAALALGPHLRHGAPALRVHVPAGEPLTPGAVGESLARARSLVRSWLGVDYPVATCTSWLLDPQLGAYLPRSSNIMAFQRRFTVVGRASPGDADVFRFVFRMAGVRPEEAPRRTRLERAVVDHVRAGRHWWVRTGWVWLP